MKLSKRSRGFTLLEVIISIAILAIILSAIFGFNIFGIKTYALGEAQWNVQSDVRALSDLITRQLRYASEVELTNQIPAAMDGYDYIRTEGDKVRYYRNGSLVSSFPATTTNSMKLTVDFTGSSGKILSFNITGNDDKNDRDYSIASKVVCLNISQGSSIVGFSGANSIRYKINNSMIDIFAVPGDRKVDFVFTKPVGAASVKLYMSDTSSLDFTQYLHASLDSNSSSASVTGLTNGKQYWFKLVVAGGEFEGESNIVTATPFKPAELTAKEVADAITSVNSPPEGAASLSVPSVPNGFEIVLKSTSNSNVINMSGGIITPSVDTTVNIMFTVRRISDGTTADTMSIPVLVKAVPAGTLDVGIKVSMNQLTNTTAKMEYRINSGAWKPCQNSITPINIIETGCMIEVRIINDIQTSNWKKFSLQQPSAPAVSFTLQNGNKGIFNYDSSLEKQLEYSTSSSGGNWLSVSKDSIKTNKISAIVVRKKATDSELPSRFIRVY